MTSAPRTARARARAEITSEIIRVARVQLSEVGPAELSLRAVARELEMVSSAVYRYFPSRDHLLTALLIEAYDELGEAVEAADAAVTDRSKFGRRIIAIARATRSWAVDHPHDYALLYGSPVRGYVAPQATVAPASRVTTVLITVIAESGVDGARPPVEITPFPRPLHTGIAGARAFTAELVGSSPDDETLMRGLMTWTTIFGALSFELFGHYVNGVADYPAFFDGVLTRLIADLGIDS